MSDKVESGTERKIRAGQTVKVVIWVLVVGAIVLFTLVNTQKVVVDWVFDETETALWIVIAVSAIAGFVVGFVTSRRRAD